MNGGLSNEIDRLQREIDQVNLLSSPAEFAQVISRDDAEPWFPYRHLVLINDRLVDLAEGRITRLMITLPPRHGKSLLCSLYLPAWYLNRYPDRRIILTSYGDDFAAEWGRKVRDLVQNHTEKLRIKINDQSKAADRWDVDGTAGGMKTAGVGGQITGRGANLFIIDDPVKSAEDAASATIRDKAWEWWQRTASTRLQPITRGGKRVQDPSLLVIQTRWHEDDLAGRFLLEDREHEWTVINLPALAEEDDLLGRTPGTALCPEIFNENALAAQRAIMGNAGFAALYQQRPQPEGGGAFKRADFRYWSTSPAVEKTYTLNDPDGSLLVPQQDCWRFITMDLALTAKTTSDWTVAAVWDVAPWLEPSRLILVHLERHRLEGAEHLDLVKKLWTAWKPNFIGIEEAMQGSMTLAASQRAGVLVRPLKHRSKDKAFRAKDAQLMLENHRVYFPRKASWLPDFEHELLLFPSGAHDDQVDCLIAGTLVETADGPRRIETISEGDRIWTRNGIRRVRAAGLSHASAEIFHVLMSDGEVLSGTRRHPVWVDGKGFVLLGELMEGDTLYRWQKSLCSMESGSVVIPTPPTPTTVATSPPDQPIEHAGSKTSIAKSGNLFMGRSRLKDKSTTLTAIGSTTIPRTWSVSRRKSMGSSTQTLNGLPSILSTWRVSDLSQPCGIAPKRDGKHTARQAVNIGLLAKQQNDPHAFGVGTRSSAAPTPKRSTARIVALPPCVGPQGSMTKHESASNAKPSSDATVTPKPSPVGPVVLAVIPGGNAAVYNLSVEGTPEYFANGVLVHNCFAYAAHELLRGVNMAKKPKVEETDTLEDKIWKQLRGRRTHDHPVLGRIR